jgi:predicted nucleic-acid-binding protein
VTIAVDTNILVRFVTRDHEKQYEAARSLMETEQIFIPESVLLETEWVLRGTYKLSALKILQAFRNILGLRNVTLADPEKIARVLDWHEAGMDFSDAFHLANSGHLGGLKTFDKDFVKRAKGLAACKVMAT